jgi:hypothetical protein
MHPGGAHEPTRNEADVVDVAEHHFHQLWHEFLHPCGARLFSFSYVTQRNELTNKIDHQEGNVIKTFFLPQPAKVQVLWCNFETCAII